MSILKESPSIIFLKKHITRYFQKEFNETPLFPNALNFEYPKTKNALNIVLFGDALLNLASPYLWIKRPIRLWTLCYSHKKLILETTRLKSSEVGVIPRDKIAQLKINSPLKHSIFNLQTAVLCSRFEANKNIEFTLQLLNEWQITQNPSLQIEIFSPLNDKSKYKQLINNMNWIKKPKLHPYAKSKWWLKVRGKNPFYINLSTSFFEDFSVSCVEAQRMGWPLVLSNWGVFRELERWPIYYIPTQKIIKNKYESLPYPTEYSFKYHLEKKMKKTKKPQIISGNKIFMISNDLSLIKERLLISHFSPLNSLNRHYRRIMNGVIK